jgi:diguanylate cyclase (GGDEF)-like protein/PAS domain S-box-containing protein
MLVMALICPCFSASAESIHLQLRWHHQFQFAGYYAAIEKGYYKKAGLNVIIHAGSPEKKPVQEVLQGHAQYGEANSELLLERLRGAPLVALAAIYQHSPSVLIARKDTGISSPDDLIGKKVMLLNHTVDADFVAMFNNEGIDINSLHVIPSSYEIRDLADGKVDAFNSYLSNEPYFLKQQGVEFTVLNPRNYGVDFYSDILFTTEDELKHHPERVKAFRQASLEGWYYAMNHPQEIIDLLINKYKVNKSREHLEFEAGAIRSLIVPDVIDLGHMNPWRWRHMTETFIKAGMVKDDKFLQDFSYEDNPLADKKKLLQYINIAVGITVLTGILSLTLLFFYRSLKQKNKISSRNEKLLLLAQETAGIAYFVINPAISHWESSPLLDQIFGIDADFLRNMSNWAKLIHPDHRHRILDRYQEIIGGCERFLLEYKIIRPSDGETRWVVVHGDIECDNACKHKQLVGTIQDITEHKEVETELRLAASAFESHEAMTITDADAVILRVNQAFTDLTGYTQEDVVGQKINLLKSGHHNHAFYVSMWESIAQTGSWRGEIWGRHKNGEIYPKWLTITAVNDTLGIVTHYVSTHVDISDRKAAEDEIKLLAFYDPLTNLPNRRLLRDRLNLALASSHRSGRKGALLFIDLDNFKTLNDTLGHDIGDLLLQQVAERLESSVREGDTVARLGGDEFVMMLEDLSEKALEAAAQTEVIGNKVLVILNKPYLLAAQNYYNTPSIGATLINGHEKSIDDLMKQADIAMYQAKASGRNTIRFFDPQMQASITAHAALESDLRQALIENQFMVYYQPQVHHNHQIIGAEVLIRWQHPQRGLVSPADFIPLAEKTGLILPIGQWVLETACAQIKTWENSVHAQHLQLAVNVSVRQFHQADFVEQILHVLCCSDIKPDRLKLELTESLVLDDIDDTILKMNKLREIGVCFSMDDFGTGYSSLAYLTKLPLDQLKIDQSFVRNIGVKPSDAVIAQTIIGMAKNLNMEVIAEGVETESQRIFLEENDCPLFQGYLFSKPVEIEQFEQLLNPKNRS